MVCTPFDRQLSSIGVTPAHYTMRLPIATVTLDSSVVTQADADTDTDHDHDLDEDDPVLVSTAQAVSSTSPSFQHRPPSQHRHRDSSFHMGGPQVGVNALFSASASSASMLFGGGGVGVGDHSITSVVGGTTTNEGSSGRPCLPTAARSRAASQPAVTPHQLYRGGVSISVPSPPVQVPGSGKTTTIPTTPTTPSPHHRCATTSAAALALVLATDASFSLPSAGAVTAVGVPSDSSSSLLLHPAFSHTAHSPRLFPTTTTTTTTVTTSSTTAAEEESTSCPEEISICTLPADLLLQSVHLTPPPPPTPLAAIHPVTSTTAATATAGEALTVPAWRDHHPQRRSLSLSRSIEKKEMESLCMVDGDGRDDNGADIADASPSSASTTIVVASLEEGEEGGQEESSVRSKSGCGVPASCGVACTQGIRNTMEDRHVMVREGDVSFFAVYDGHGGSQCAEFLQEHLHHIILAHPELKTNPEKAIRDGIMEADRHFLSQFVLPEEDEAAEMCGGGGAGLSFETATTTTTHGRSPTGPRGTVGEYSTESSRASCDVTSMSNLSSRTGSPYQTYSPRSASPLGVLSGELAGAVAAVALVMDGQVHVGNVGDTEAVLLHFFGREDDDEAESSAGVEVVDHSHSHQSNLNPNTSRSSTASRCDGATTRLSGGDVSPAPLTSNISMIHPHHHHHHHHCPPRGNHPISTDYPFTTTSTTNHLLEKEGSGGVAGLSCSTVCTSAMTAGTHHQSGSSEGQDDGYLLLTEKHAVSSESEQRRLLATGGCRLISQGQRIRHPKNKYLSLDVSRSIGDARFKLSRFTGGVSTGVTADPFVRSIRTMTTTAQTQPQQSHPRRQRQRAAAPALASRKTNVMVNMTLMNRRRSSSRSGSCSSDSCAAHSHCGLQEEGEIERFVVIACDGLWGVMPHTEVARILKSALHQHSAAERRSSAVMHSLADTLVQTALQRGATDNITVLVTRVG